MRRIWGNVASSATSVSIEFRHVTFFDSRPARQEFALYVSKVPGAVVIEYGDVSYARVVGVGDNLLVGYHITDTLGYERPTIKWVVRFRLRP